METAQLQRLAFPGVALLIAFLAFSSQYLFAYIEPGPLRKGDAYFFFALIACLYICYARACFTDPGRIPKDWQKLVSAAPYHDESVHDIKAEQRHRWCRRCDAPKPPRAHHCKTCKRHLYWWNEPCLTCPSCIVKMDHHCVWTANCVSHITLPHFMRFLFYAIASMIYLQYFLYLRCAVLWVNRRLPSYLGPSVPQLAHLFLLVVTNSLVLFALVLLFGRTVWSLSLNMTTIEGWEVERHEAVLRRQRALGGFVDAPDGTRYRVERQEFPWDVGIWSNLCQTMGTRNPLSWLWPFAASLKVESGLVFEHNEIDDPGKPWPPPDPDRMFRVQRMPPPVGNAFTGNVDIKSFKQRQAMDQARYTNLDGEYIIRRRPFHERYAQAASPKVQEIHDDGDVNQSDDDLEDESAIPAPNAVGDEGEEAWRNREGERLADFGVEEDIEFYDEDNIPLAELMRRRKKQMAE